MKRIREITALYLCRLIELLFYIKNRPIYMRDLRFQIQARMHLATEALEI